jgi:hypothetical protein
MPSQSYMKHISDFAGVTLLKGEPVSPNLVRLLLPATTPFLSEYLLLLKGLGHGLTYNNIKTGQTAKDCEETESHFNKIKFGWSFNLASLEIIHGMALRFTEFVHSDWIKVITIPKMYVTPCYLFITQFRDYLSHCLHEFFKEDPKNHELLTSIPMQFHLTSICTSLAITFSDAAFNGLAIRLAAVGRELQSCLFDNDFKDVL